MIWGVLNMFSHIYFLFELSLRLYGAKDFYKYLLSSESMVDIISIFPFFLTRIFTGDFWYLGERNNWIIASDLTALFRILRY